MLEIFIETLRCLIRFLAMGGESMNLLKYVELAVPFELTISTSLRDRTIIVELFDRDTMTAKEKTVDMSVIKQQSEEEVLATVIEGVREEVMKSIRN